MTTAFSRKPKPVTAERIERSLDRLAEIMVKVGDEAFKVVPIYERLKMELAAYRAREQKMVEVRERAKRSKARSTLNPGCTGDVMADSFLETAKKPQSSCPILATGNKPIRSDRMGYDPNLLPFSWGIFYLIN